MSVIEKPTTLQAIGIWITIILTIILIVLAIICIKSFSDINVPEPKLTESDTKEVQEANEKRVSNYKTWVETEVYKRERKFDFAINKILIPMFDELVKIILIFIFGIKGLSILDTYVKGKWGNVGGNRRT